MTKCCLSQIIIYKGVTVNYKAKTVSPFAVDIADLIYKFFDRSSNLFCLVIPLCLLPGIICPIGEYTTLLQ